jgi:hypothetical protein
MRVSSRAVDVAHHVACASYALVRHLSETGNEITVAHCDYLELTIQTY